MTTPPTAGGANFKKSTSLSTVIKFYLRHLLFWCVLAICAYWIWIDRAVISAFERRRWDLPARLYASPLQLYGNRQLRVDELADTLSELGYRKVVTPIGPGQFSVNGNQINIWTRGFNYPDGNEPARAITVAFDAGRVISLVESGSAAPIGVIRLEPLEIGRIHPEAFEDRLIVSIAETPEPFLKALITTEDRRFYDHVGVDLIGIARAMFANVLAGSVTQGGSTLTQQLVKNLYLTRQRSLWRKFNEALMALSLERRYQKQEIIEAYINEVFLGQDGNRAIHGFGLGARFYFGRPLDELTMPEYALLIGIVKGPTGYNPYRHPERALKRRNAVLRILYDQAVISAEQFQTYTHTPLELRRGKWTGSSRYRGFLELVNRQLKRDYRDSDLQTAGLKVFTTLDMLAQRAAEAATRSTLDELGRVRKQSGKLQAALVVTDTRTADIKALIADRDSAAEGFNRALDARRPIGSLIKPFVYLTALAQAGKFNVASQLNDQRHSWQDRSGHVWEPKNYDGQEYGPLPMYEAIARSLNLATVDLGFRVGVEAIAQTLQRLGFQGELPQYPSLFLGAVDMSPYEVAQLYQVIANDGFRIPLRAIRAVVDANNRPLKRYGLEVQQVIDSSTAFLTRYLLTRVVEQGTARAVAVAFPEALPVAGKTGTSDDSRDSWFAGFGGDNLGIVWIGRDDNQPTGFTGAAGALKVWIKMMKQIRLSPLNMDPPPAVEWHWVSGDGTALSAQTCPGARFIPINIEHLPQRSEDCSVPHPGLWEQMKGVFQ